MFSKIVPEYFFNKVKEKHLQGVASGTHLNNSFSLKYG